MRGAQHYVSQSLEIASFGHLRTGPSDSISVVSDVEVVDVDVVAVDVNVDPSRMSLRY